MKCEVLTVTSPAFMAGKKCLRLIWQRGFGNFRSGWLLFLAFAPKSEVEGNSSTMSTSDPVSARASTHQAPLTVDGGTTWLRYHRGFLALLENP